MYFADLNLWWLSTDIIAGAIGPKGADDMSQCQDGSSQNLWREENGDGKRKGEQEHWAKAKGWRLWNWNQPREP